MKQLPQSVTALIEGFDLKPFVQSKDQLIKALEQEFEVNDPDNIPNIEIVDFDHGLLRYKVIYPKRFAVAFRPYDNANPIAKLMTFEQAEEVDDLIMDKGDSVLIQIGGSSYNVTKYFYMGYRERRSEIKQLEFTLTPEERKKRGVSAKASYNEWRKKVAKS